MTFAKTAATPQIISVIQGEYAVSDQPNVTMSTVLGSCIAACLYDQNRRVGGMNHFLLPEAKTGDGQNVKYGAYLMELLINDLLKMGAQRHHLRAKLVGGGKMSQLLGDVGAKNIEFGRRYLINEGIPIDWESMGGVQARRVHFYPTTGELKEKFVQNDAQIDKPAVVARRPKRQSNVELF